MVKAVISNNEIIHEGNFGIHVTISHPIANLQVSDFVLRAVDGNGITGIELPDALEVAYLGKQKQTVLMLPIDIPDSVSGSFGVSMRDKEYAVDNIQYETSDTQVELPSTEQQRIQCDEKIFRYITGA